MKLGAIISSERGKPVKKTGNAYIHTSINDELGNKIAYMTIDSERIIFSIIDTDISVSYKRNGSLKHGKKYIRCPWCGKNIPDSNPFAQYCSSKCRYDATGKR